MHAIHYLLRYVEITYYDIMTQWIYCETFRAELILQLFNDLEALKNTLGHKNVMQLFPQYCNN